MRRIKLSNSKERALIDDSDYALVSQRKWRALRLRHNTYAVSSGPPHPKTGNTTMIYMHRLILGAKDGEEVDHEGHNGLDNRRAKIRLCTHLQNVGNQRKTTRARLSKYKGVTYDDRGFWKAQIGRGGIKINLGSFRSERVAAAAYDIAARKQFGAFAHTNQMPVSVQKRAQAEIDNPKKRDGSSKFRGVCWCPARKTWRATCCKRHFGRYQSEEEAAAAYNEAAIKLLGDKAKLNQLP